MMKTRKGHNVYPITVAQKFHLYYAKYCPNMAVLNIGTSLTIGTELDWNVLRDSINYAYARSFFICSMYEHISLGKGNPSYMALQYISIISFKNAISDCASTTM